MPFNLLGVPENLPPGKYATRVVDAKYGDDGLVVDLMFAGPYDPDDPCLFPIDKADES